MTTRDEMTAYLTACCPWFDLRDLDAFLAPDTSDEERAIIVRVYRDAGVPLHGPSSWEAFLIVLHACADVAGSVLPILGVVTAVYSLARS